MGSKSAAVGVKGVEGGRGAAARPCDDFTGDIATTPRRASGRGAARREAMPGPAGRI